LVAFFAAFLVAIVDSDSPYLNNLVLLCSTITGFIYLKLVKNTWSTVVGASITHLDTRSDIFSDSKIDCKTEMTTKAARFEVISSSMILRVKHCRSIGKLSPYTAGTSMFIGLPLLS
jgi:hypothetical protein